MFANRILTGWYQVQIDLKLCVHMMCHRKHPAENAQSDVLQREGKGDAQFWILKQRLTINKTTISNEKLLAQKNNNDI